MIEEYRDTSLIDKTKYNFVFNFSDDDLEKIRVADSLGELDNKSKYYLQNLQAALAAQSYDYLIDEITGSAENIAFNGEKPQGYKTFNITFKPETDDIKNIELIYFTKLHDPIGNGKFYYRFYNNFIEATVNVSNDSLYVLKGGIKFKKSGKSRKFKKGGKSRKFKRSVKSKKSFIYKK
jgi:hypothetical protein